jgi:fibronectin-binding autotransporter adhesin
MDMLGLTSALGATARVRTIGIAAAAVLTLIIWAPAAANASGCTDSWTNTAGGSWFTPGNWSTKAVPTSSDEACITAAGTYTVEMAQTATVTVKALTVGAASGTQTLLVESTNVAHAVLTTSAGLSNGVHGAITLTNAETAGNNVTIAGPVANAGSVTVEPGKGGVRTLSGSFTNTGTLAVNAGTSFNGTKALLSNEGSLNLATGTQLVLSGESAIRNASGGKIVATGTGDVLVEPGSTFNEGAGTTSGSKPVIVRDASLNYTGAGSSAIAVHGEGGKLSGSLASGQSLSIESTNAEHATETASASFTNAGAIALTSTEANPNHATLAISSGTLTNSGSIKVEVGVGGERYLSGSITNTGTVAVNATARYNGEKAALNNQGTLSLATGVVLIASNGATVTDGLGGSIVASGTGNVLVEPGSAYSQGAGTTSGSKPVIVRDAALIYTGSGASLITTHGTGTTLSGNISVGQSLVIESIDSEHSYVTAAASFSNAGAITLTSTEVNPNQAALILSSGTLTNSGSISIEAGVGGARYLDASVTNTGTITVNATTKYEAENAVLTNDGALKLAAGAQLIVTNKGAVVNGAGGSITAGEGGAVDIEPGSSFTEGAGTTSGTKPVIVRDAALIYTGSGASLITTHGQSTTLSGNISVGQSLVIESINGEHSYATAASSFTNAGTITLTSTEANPNQAALTVSSGTLTNSGSIKVETGVGGARYIQGNVTNTGTITINASTQYNISGAVLVNQGTISIASGVVLNASANPTISNEAGGIVAVTGTGALVQTEGTFNQGLGKTTTVKTSEPVILVRVALHYTGAGASKITQQAASSLSGPISKGQTLTIESSCTAHAEVSAAASFLNSGTLNLTNAGTCANNVTLTVAGGAGTLENKGTINVLFPHGGVRSIAGSLINASTLAIANDPSQSLKVSGSFSQGAKATLKNTIAGATNYSRLTVTGSVVLGGKLALKQVKFTGKAGETFAIVTGASRTGEFSSVTGNAIKNTLLHYVPHYTATAANLIVE